MTCIVCGTESSFRCSIKGMTVCFCSEHMENKEKYDMVALEEDSEEESWQTVLPPGDVCPFPSQDCHVPTL